MQQKKEKLFVCLLMTLIIIQPLLDLVWLNDGTIGEVFGFTIPTIVRIGMVAILGGLSFFAFKFQRSHLFLGGYALIIGVYFVMHHVNALDFYSFVPGDFDYSVIGEAFYVIRMCIPIVMMYFVYNSKFGRNEFDRSVIGIVVIMSGIVVITNILEVAICSYSENIIAGNIFDWFLNKGVYNHNQLASKGWFYVSIVSMVLILLLPYMFYLYIDTNRKRYLGIGILQAVSLFMFGTKATSYSVVIILILMCALYLFSTLIKKEYKFNVKMSLILLAVLVGSVCLLQYSPTTARVEFDAEYGSDMDEEEEELKEQISNEYDFTDEQDIIRFFDDHYHMLSINEKILKEAYPYEYDPTFWYEFYANRVASQRMQNRIVQEEVLKRLFEVNDNELDKYLGIGYTRTSNVFNLEKDFIYQYYSMGIIGAALLVGPYIVILIVVMFAMLIRHKNKLTLLNCSLVLGCGLTCCLAYYSGNTLESLGVSIVLGSAYGYLLKNNWGKMREA